MSRWQALSSAVAVVAFFGFLAHSDYVDGQVKIAQAQATAKCPKN